jgi:hypothetical protein
MLPGLFTGCVSLGGGTLGIELGGGNVQVRGSFPLRQATGGKEPIDMSDQIDRPDAWGSEPAAELPTSHIYNP